MDDLFYKPSCGSFSQSKQSCTNCLCFQVCTSCSPAREFVRLFDVTERTSLHRHGTGRLCSHCGSELRDTIVHFGERGTLEQPLNWKGAAEAANEADVILCLGSSLKAGFVFPLYWLLCFTLDMQNVFQFHCDVFCTK